MKIAMCGLEMSYRDNISDCHHVKFLLHSKIKIIPREIFIPSDLDKKSHINKNGNLPS